MQGFRGSFLILGSNGLTTGQIGIPVPDNPRSNRYLLTSQRTTLIQELLRRLATLPDAQNVAIGRSNDVPFQGNVRNPVAFSRTKAGVLLGIVAWSPA